MQVRHILYGKGRDVVAIETNATICDAAQAADREADRRPGGQG